MSARSAYAPVRRLLLFVDDSAEVVSSADGDRSALQIR